MTKTIRVSLTDEEKETLDNASELLGVIAEELSQCDNGTQCDTNINYNFDKLSELLGFIQASLN